MFECSSTVSGRWVLSGVALVLFWLAGPAAWSEGSGAKTPPTKVPEVELRERVTVIGSAERALDTPGSAHYLDRAELSRQGHTDVHRALQQVPGILVQDEDGYGLRPNIGLRGTGVERSQKITLLEDGVLIAPAPYTAPAAYYFPTIGRMDAIEVQKGTASVRQGPYTTGGVINLISTPVPPRRGFSIDAAAGSHGTGRLRAMAGGSGERWSYLLETFQHSSDGFKTVDPDAAGHRPDSGFKLHDYLGKLRYSASSEAPLQHSLVLKLGNTLQRGDETYLGLTDADVRATPFRRYAASALDAITTDHEQVQLRWFAFAGGRFDITATGYDNSFARDWFKNEKIGGTSNAAVLANPAAYPEWLAILRGEADSESAALTLRHNARDYSSRGAEVTLGLTLGGDGPGHARVEHGLEVGGRIHQDAEDRLQADDFYTMRRGGLVLSHKGSPGSQANRLSQADAFSLYVQDTVRFARLTLTAGVRYENIDYQRFDFLRSDPERLSGPARVRSNGVDVLIPGLGATWAIGQRQRLVLGLHKGFSPPGAGRDEQTRPEESLNIEAGHRWQGQRWSSAVIGFWNDFSNLLGIETVSGGGAATGELWNGGGVDVRGVEASVRTRLAAGRRFDVPLSFSYTLTRAEFRTSFSTGFADWAPFVERGDALPYLPEHQLALRAGAHGARFGVDLSVAFQDQSRSTAGHGPIAPEESIDSRWVTDLSTSWRVGSKGRLYLQARNLLGEEYVVARRPYGARPGLPRTLLLGIDLEF